MLVSSKENILVLRREDIVPQKGFFGILPTDIDKLFDTISTKGMFVHRSVAEHDERYKQIIPYLIYQHKNSFFLMQRSESSGEQRLKNAHSLGIGGHIRESDLQDSQSILDWAKREFLEEVNFNGNYKPLFLGLLNDDSNAVGRVHIGLVFLLRGNTDDISVRSELKSGQLVCIEDLITYQESMETWSKIVVQHLLNSLSSGESFKAMECATY